VLKLSRTPEWDDLPYVSIITITRDRDHMFDIPIHNWHSFDYPSDKMEWIIIDDSVTPLTYDKLPKVDNIRYIHVPSNEPLSIAEKRNLAVSEAKYDIIAHMDDDDYYYPISLQARIKTLLNYN